MSAVGDETGQEACVGSSVRMRWLLTYSRGINLGIQPGLADEVDDPFLGLIRGHSELLRKHAGRERAEEAAKSQTKE